MIDEDVLTELLGTAARSHNPPPDGPATIAWAVGEQPPGSHRTGRRRPALVLTGAASVVLLAVVGAAVLRPTDEPQLTDGFASPTGARTATTAAGEGTIEADGLTGAPAAPAPSLAPQAATDPAAAAPAPAAAGSAPADGGLSERPAGGGAAASLPSAPSQAAPADARVVKTGSLDVEVPEGRFEETVDRLTALVVGSGGFVAAAETTEDDEDPRGSLTLRVPAGRFEELVTEVRRLGDVRSAVTAGEDVSARYTDIEARLRALTATRDQYLFLLGRAEAIPDILAVQDRINGLQVEIESLQGQQRLLDDQTGFGTLTVTLAEPGDDRLVAEEPEEVERGRFAKAWDDARRGFTDGLAGLLAGSGKAALALLCFGVVAIGLRIVWLVFRRRLLL